MVAGMLSMAGLDQPVPFVGRCLEGSPIPLGTDPEPQAEAHHGADIGPPLS